MCSRAWKRSRSSARSMASGDGADDRNPGLLQRHRQLQRRLAAELDDDSDGFLDGDDLQHVLQGEGLEVEPVGGVVVGGDGLGVAVDHDRLEPVLGQGEDAVDAAVVELDPLADAVGAAAEDHDLLAIGRRRLAFALVGGVEVGGVGLELGAAGVDPLVDRADFHVRDGRVRTSPSVIPQSCARRRSEKPSCLASRSSSRKGSAPALATRPAASTSRFSKSTIC